MRKHLGLSSVRPFHQDGIEVWTASGGDASTNELLEGDVLSISELMGRPDGVKPILLLTNNDNTNPFAEWLVSRGETVVRVEDALTADLARELNPRIAVSFNYRHIVKADAIEAIGCAIVNVHCSVLPWNRGASPNFFSYLDNTPKGVTVHELTAGLDKGGIVLQEKMELDEDETFVSSYAKLIECGIRLLEENWNSLLDWSVSVRPQEGAGSYHSVKDFEEARARWPFQWEERVCDWKRRNGLP